MDIFGNVQAILVIAGAVVGLIIIGVIVYFAVKARYKAAEATQALVVSGGKGGPKILVSGGAWVSPFHKFSYFPLSAIIIKSNGKTALTSTMVQVVVEWAATVFANTEKEDALKRAVVGFGGLKPDQIANELQPTLDGVVRSIVAGMTPTELVTDNKKFSDSVAAQVTSKMAELGFSVRTMVIGDITDNKEHYDNLAAEDREDKRRTAKRLKAKADEEIRTAEAASDQAAQASEQARDMEVADQQRELALRKSEIEVETATAAANAEIAGELQRELRNQELATRRGEVKVVEARQEQAAALAQRETELTRAETDKQRKIVEAQAAKEQSALSAEADARKSEIAAQAAATVAQRQAEGEAKAAVTRAQGEADAINRTTEAKAEQVRKTGLAEAEVTKAQGEAEAAATLAKGTAEAEVQRLKAEALAANNGANLQVTLAEIQRDTTVRIYTAVGEAMGHIGEKATFIDMGGNGSSDGDLLSSVLGRVPEMLKKLDVKSTALHGTSFGGTMNSLISSVANGDPSNGVTPAAVIESTASPQSDETGSVKSPEGGEEPSEDEH